MYLKCGATVWIENFDNYSKYLGCALFVQVYVIFINSDF